MADHTPLEIETAFDLEATMRDGTTLHPGVLTRLDPFGAARRGYLVIIQDCRGRFRSDGHWAPRGHESTDGYDTIGWAAKGRGVTGPR